MMVDYINRWRTQTLIKKGEWLDQHSKPFRIAAFKLQDIHTEWIEGENPAEDAWQAMQVMDDIVDYFFQLALEIDSIRTPGSEEFQGPNALPVVLTNYYACPEHYHSIVIPPLVEETKKTSKKEVKKEEK